MTGTQVQLIIAWWNTSLSPLAKPRAVGGDSDRDIACDIISVLIKDLGVDCLALGEVSSDDLNMFMRIYSSSDFGVLDGTLVKGNLRFDTGLIYNKHRLNMTNFAPIISNYGHQSLRIAQRVDLQICDTNEPLYLFILHWPSRLWSPQYDAKRDTLGMRLRSSIEELQQANEAPPQIILIGDFNDEPFDEPLANHLLASRDRAQVEKYNSLLYNPFWRHLGERKPYTLDFSGNSICGSYFHRSGVETCWRTFDQIIVSSSFLKGDSWSINEELTFVLDNAEFVELVKDSSRIFDHLPVICVLQRRID